MRVEQGTSEAAIARAGGANGRWQESEMELSDAVKGQDRIMERQEPERMGLTSD